MDQFIPQRFAFGDRQIPLIAQATNLIQRKRHVAGFGGAYGRLAQSPRHSHRYYYCQDDRRNPNEAAHRGSLAVPLCQHSLPNPDGITEQGLPRLKSMLSDHTGAINTLAAPLSTILGPIGPTIQPKAPGFASYP